MYGLGSELGCPNCLFAQSDSVDVCYSTLVVDKFHELTAPERRAVYLFQIQGSVWQREVRSTDDRPGTNPVRCRTQLFPDTGTQTGRDSGSASSFRHLPLDAIA